MSLPQRFWQCGNTGALHIFKSLVYHPISIYTDTNYIKGNL